MPRLLDEIEHERQTVDTLRDNICVMTVELFDDKDEIKRLIAELGIEIRLRVLTEQQKDDEVGRLKEVARELAEWIQMVCPHQRASCEECQLECIVTRPDVAELRGVSDA